MLLDLSPCFMAGLHVKVFTANAHSMPHCTGLGVHIALASFHAMSEWAF